MIPAPRPCLRLARHALLVVTGYTLVTIGFYWRLFAWQPEQRRVFGWDCLEQFWPDMVFQFNALSGGEWPLWNPYHRGGYPYTAESFSGLYYPPQWVLLALAAALGGVPMGLMHAKVLGHLILGAALLYGYARSRGAPAVGAFLGGVVFSFSGYMAFAKDLALWSWSWLPLCLLCIDRLVARPEPFRGALLGAAVGIAALASPPVALFYLLLVSGPYLVFRAVDTLGVRRAVRTLALPLLCAALLALGLSLVHYAPQFAIIPVSDRGDRSLDYVLLGSLPPHHLVRLFVPGLLHGGAMYMGLLPLLLCAVALAAPPAGDRTPFFFGGVALLGLLLAFGQHAGLLERAASFLPGFGLFRMAERYLMLVGAAGAVLCAYGTMALARPHRGIFFGAVGYLALLFGGLLLSFGPRPLAQRLVSADGVALSLVFAAATLVLLGPSLWSGRAVGPLRGACLIGLVLLDLWSGQKNFLSIYELPRDHHRDAELRRFPGVRDHWRLYDEYYFEQRVGARRGVRDFYDYYIAPLTLQRYVDVMERARRDASILRHYNVRWMLHGPHHRKGLSIHTIPTSAVRAGYQQTEVSWIYEAKEVAPALVHYPVARIVSQPQQVLDLLSATVPGSQAFVEAADLTEQERVRLAAMKPQGHTAPTPGRVVRLRVNSVLSEIDAPTEGLVVSNEVYYPGWEATVDGQPARVLRANYLLRAVLVGPGHHVIEWRFRPRSFLILFPLYLLSLAVLLVWGTVRTVRGR
ncbi:MAG: hypothetical protein RMK29_05155 [Myxococcales bacterium]|nr:YfhO family protein [Myxococcota bacterium]MDW8281078.1 hypothetical protein [Myxococcales bacterium]